MQEVGAVLANVQVLVAMQHSSSVMECAPGRQCMQSGQQADYEAGSMVSVQGEAGGVDLLATNVKLPILSGMGQ